MRHPRSPTTPPEDRGLQVGACVLLLAAGALLASCASVETGGSWDTTVDFSAYTTFAFRPDRQLEDIYRQRAAERFIVRTLAGKGLRLDTQRPSMLIGLAPEVGPTIERDIIPSGSIVWATWGPYEGLWLSPGRPDVKEAGVTISMRDAASDRLLWRSSVVGQIATGDPAKIERKLLKALDRMLSRYPPPAE